MPIYNFDKNYFDVIDSEEKAYWLGFIWCDGTVSYRTRKNLEEYYFKIDLKIEDREHLEKLKKSLSSNHKIKEYQSKGYIDTYICRLYICNKYFGQNLYNNFGLEPNRSNSDLCWFSVPEDLKRHFIRGVLDADGSFSFRFNKTHYKASVRFSTYQNLNEHISKHLYASKIVKSINKQFIRHEGRDGYCKTLDYSGAKQSYQLLSYLYSNSNIYLKRKNDKYISFKNDYETYIGI